MTLDALIQQLAPISRWRAPWKDVYSVVYQLRGLPSEGAVFIGTTRGKKMRTRIGVFDGVGGLLQFPPYFGESWNAFNDSFSDLEWLRAGTILVVILNAENVLRDGDRGEIEDFLGYVGEAIERLAKPRVEVVDPVQLRLVLQTELLEDETNDPYAEYPFIDLGAQITGS